MKNFRKKLLAAAVLVAFGTMNSLDAGDRGRGGARPAGNGIGSPSARSSHSGHRNIGPTRNTTLPGATMSLPSNTLGHISGGTVNRGAKTQKLSSLGQKVPALAGAQLATGSGPSPLKSIKKPIQPPSLTPGGPLKPLPNPAASPVKPIKPQLKPFTPPVVAPGGPGSPFPAPTPPINPNPAPYPPRPPIHPNHPGSGHRPGYGHHWHYHWHHWVGCINFYFRCPRVIQPCPLPCAGDTVIVSPQVTETVVLDSVTRIGIDLAVREVRVLSQGDDMTGTLYRVLISNHGSVDLIGTARIALFAVGNAQPDASTPQVLGEFDGLKSGETAIVDVRMPVAGNTFPNLLVAVEIPEGVQDLNEANNVAIGEVARLPVEVASP